jgi:hypothetical protein
VFPVRYELNSYIIIRRNSVFKGLIIWYENWWVPKLEDGTHSVAAGINHEMDVSPH